MCGIVSLMCKLPQGTRVHVYRWLRNAVARSKADGNDLKSLPEIKTKEEWVKKIHPGEFDVVSRRPKRFH